MLYNATESYWLRTTLTPATLYPMKFRPVDSYGNAGNFTWYNVTTQPAVTPTVTPTATPTPQPKPAPGVVGFAPLSPVFDVEGAVRTFNVSVNQSVDVFWYINGTFVQSNLSVFEASYSNVSAVLGVWNVSAVATNVNGSAIQTWIWNVTALPVTPTPTVTPTPLPSSISNLHNVSYAQNYIDWAWDDPPDANFDHVEVYIDNSFKTSVAKGIQFYHASGFAPDSLHTISTHTADQTGNVNSTWVNHTARTAPPAYSSIISGYKINDSNGNGRWDAGEKGISNWTIRLIGISGTARDNKIIRKTTLTDSTGFYAFYDLPAGRYLVIEGQEKGFAPTKSPVKHIKLAQGERSLNNNFTNRPVKKPQCWEHCHLGSTPTSSDIDIDPSDFFKKEEEREIRINIPRTP